MNVQRLHQLAVSDTGFIFDPITGNSFTANDIGIKILNLLKQGLDILDVKSEIFGEYEISENELESDINDFMQMLKNYHLISK